MHKLTIGAVLDRVRDVRGLKSDYAISKAYGISTQKLANWRHERNLPDEKSCKVLAEAAQIDPFVLIAQVHAMRAQDNESRSIWEAIAERLNMGAAHALAVILSVVVAMGMGAGDAYAASASAQQAKAGKASNSLYIVSSLESLLILAVLWLLARFDRGFTPCFVPTK